MLDVPEVQDLRWTEGIVADINVWRWDAVLPAVAHSFTFSSAHQHRGRSAAVLCFISPLEATHPSTPTRRYCRVPAFL